MDGFEKDGYWWFNCGCHFRIIGKTWGKSKIPKVRVISDLHNPNHTINFNCPATWELLAKGFSKGVFQLESPLGRQWTKKLKPESKEHISALGSILRPGSLKALDDDGVSMTQHYCRRKNLEEETPDYHPVVDKILEKSYNCLIYQEQSMLLARELANFTLQEADVLRKAIGKKLPEEMAKVKKLFLEKAKEAKVVSEAQAEEIFGWIEKSQRYSFNKSHAASYGETGYACAYAKTHFPLSFYCNWLRLAQEKPDPHEEITELVKDARVTSNIKIRTPDIRFLRDRVHSDGENIYFGLMDIKGIGESNMKKLYATWKTLGKEFIEQLDWISFLVYIGGEIPSTVMDGFIISGALSYFRIDRSLMIRDYNIWTELTNGEKECIKTAIKHVKFDDIVSLIRYIIDNKGYHTDKKKKVLEDILDGLLNPTYNVQDTIDYLIYSEEELLGVALTCHVCDSITEAIETCTCKDIIQGRKAYSVLKVYLNQVRSYRCKRGNSAGKKMAFVQASDNSCLLDNIVVFPDKYEEYGHLLNEENIVYLSGKLDDKGSFIVERAYEYNRSGTIDRITN